MSSMNEGTGEGLVEFLEWMIDKGIVKSATGSSYRSAVLKVLEIEGEEWKATDIRHLDVDEQVSRFSNISGHNYTPGSLNTYCRRFEKAVSQYRDYLESPSAFKTSVSPRKAPKPRSSDDQQTDSSGETPRGQETPRPAKREATSTSTSTDLIEYAFPLRSGDTAYFRLPRLFSASEVDRMATFLSALSIEKTEGGENEN